LHWTNMPLHTTRKKRSGAFNQKKTVKAEEAAR